jgi:hypothetical protein
VNVHVVDAPLGPVIVNAAAPASVERTVCVSPWYTPGITRSAVLIRTVVALTVAVTVAVVLPPGDATETINNEMATMKSFFIDYPWVIENNSFSILQHSLTVHFTRDCNTPVVFFGQPQ